jgi:hypothetical protein
MTVYVADEHAHVQRLDLVFKMVTVFDEYNTEEQHVVVLSVIKYSMQKILIKKYFLFTVGSVCRVNGFTTGSINSLRTFESRR